MDVLGIIQKVVAVAFQYGEKLVTLLPNDNVATPLGANVEFMLPNTAADDVLVSEAAPATMTNKRLTSPKLNEDVAVSVTATKLNYLSGVSGALTTDAAIEITKGTPADSQVLSWSAANSDFRPQTLSTDQWTIGTIADAMTLGINTEYENDGTPDVDTLTLPSAPAQGSRIRLIDTGQNWYLNNIVVSRGGSDTIYNGSDTTLTLDIENSVVELVYYGTNWSVIVG